MIIANDKLMMIYVGVAAGSILYVVVFGILNRRPGVGGGTRGRLADQEEGRPGRRRRRRRRRGSDPSSDQLPGLVRVGFVLIGFAAMLTVELVGK